MERIITIKNKKIHLIDESYNANPETMKICLIFFDKLELQKNQKKILILGDMNELGTYSKKYHQNIITQIIENKFNNVILCGQIFKSALDDMINKKNNIKYMSNEKEILKYLSKNINNYDIMLIKGSNSTKVNKLANLLIKNKE